MAGRRCILRARLESGHSQARSMQSSCVTKSRCSTRRRTSSPEPEPCRDLFHKRVGDPDRPYAEHMIGRRHPFDNKPEPVRRPGSEYAFDTTYRLPEEPADDVVERRSQLRAVNSMLT